MQFAQRFGEKKSQITENILLSGAQPIHPSVSYSGTILELLALHWAAATTCGLRDGDGRALRAVLPSPPGGVTCSAGSASSSATASSKPESSTANTSNTRGAGAGGHTVYSVCWPTYMGSPSILSTHVGVMCGGRSL